MSGIEKMVNSKTAGAVIILAGVFFSYQIWTLIWARVQPSPQEIVSISMQPAAPGQLAEYTGRYFKRRDCPGTWTIRLLDSASIWHTLGDGSIGAHPPGEYTYTGRLLVPSAAVPGPATVTEVQAVICSDITHIARAEAATIIRPVRQ